MTGGIRVILGIVFVANALTTAHAVNARTNALEPLLQIRHSGGQIEVMWPGEFPHGRLFSSANLNQPWQETVISGAPGGTLPPACWARFLPPWVAAMIG